MRLPALTIAAVTALTFAFPDVPVLAQGHDDGALGPPVQLYGGSSSGSTNRGQGGRSESTERSTGAISEKTQTQAGQGGETTTRGTRTGWKSRARHHFVMHMRGHHVFAFRMPRHHFVIHRYGRRFVAFNEPRVV